MQKFEKYIPYVFILLLLALFCIQLQSVQQFIFFHREQQQVLAWDFDLITDRYFGVSGLSLFLAHFITQVFYLPYAGPAITAILAVLSSCCIWKGLSKIGDIPFLAAFCFIPAMLELSYLNDAYYYYQGFISFVLLSILVWMYGQFVSRFSIYIRLGIGILLVLLLFYLTGSISLYLAIFIFLFDVLSNKDKSYYQVLTLLLSALVLYYAVRWCWLPSTRAAFSHDLYYNPLIEAPANFKYSWITFCFLPILFFLGSKKYFSGLKVRITCCIIFFLGVGYGAYALSENNRKATDPLYEMQNYVITENWDAILRSPQAHSRNYLMMNYVNLALSKKGLLLTHFFDYEQPDDQNIMVFRESDDTNVPLAFIFSFITYQMGDMGAAQNHAHDTFVCTPYGHPTMLKTLIKTNLIKGAYPVAEKYINLLEKTWRYGDWAKGMRKFLYNDKAVLADSELGTMRRDLPNDDFFTLDSYECLRHTLATNPSDQRVRDYLIAYLYIYKDQDDTNQFVEQFYNTPALKPMPEQVQEMFLLVNDGNYEYCHPYGVSEETMNRYVQFMRALDAAEGRGMNPAQVLRKDYGQTIWYHFMFN